MLEKRGRGRGRGAKTRGRGKSKGTRGRGRKLVPKNSAEFHDDEIEDEEEDEEIAAHIEEEPEQGMIIPEGISLEEDILQLETPTFTTIDRGPPEPMLRLRWDHRVNLIGEKVLNPMIHVCELCQNPILIYGRMIACKHVFCLACAQKDSKVCARCEDKVDRVEQAGLGSIFMCTHGGTRYGTTGCRRTYMSSRDLQAHISHRHMNRAVSHDNPDSRSVPSHSSIPQKIETVKEQSRAVEPSPRDPRRHVDSGPLLPDTPPVRQDTYSSHQSHPMNSNTGGSYHSMHQTQGSHIPVLNTRSSTLITVPLQDTSPEAYPPLSQPLAYPSPTYVSTQPYNYPQTVVSYAQPPPPTHYPPPHLNYPPPPPHVPSYSQTPPQPPSQYPDPQYTTQWNTPPPPPPRLHGQSAAHQYYRQV